MAKYEQKLFDENSLITLGENRKRMFFLFRWLTWQGIPRSWWAIRNRDRRRQEDMWEGR